MRLVRNDIRSAVDDLLRNPPATPVELVLRLVAFDHEVACAELVRRLADTELDQEGQLLLVNLLIELVTDETIPLIAEVVVDGGRTDEARALTLMVLTSTCGEQMPEQVRSLPTAEMEKIFRAATGWLASANRKKRVSRRGSTAAKRVCRIKVTLRDTRPPVWRRIEVTDDITFARLHQVIQRAMGWTNSHLHGFDVAGERIGVPDGEEEVTNEKSIRLRDVVGEGIKRFDYDYDFGDDWQHAIVIEKVLEPEKGVRYPRCVAGKRACPPEDCGGAHGHEELIATLADPDHERHEEMREWAGDWEPERFDLDAVDRRLRGR